MGHADPLPYRLVTVQFGDFAGALARQARGEPETYYAQDFTVRHVASYAARLAGVAVVTAAEDQAPTHHDNGVVTAGVQLYPPGKRARHKDLLRLVEQLQPTHLLLETPVVPLLRWAIERRVNTLPIFFDSFNGTGLRAKLRYRQLAQALNAPQIRWVGNHGLSAAEDLVRIGVAPQKVLPIDWPALLDPELMPPWIPNASDGPFKLVYVGTLSEAKGTGDLIRAVGALRDDTRRFELTLIGAGDDDAMRALAGQCGVADRVDFMGKIPHDDVLVQMRLHDAVVVPSRHEYPEGLPMTIYEAFCAKAPLIVSDHPMFRRKVKDQENALVVPERNPAALADALRSIESEPTLGQQLSENAARDAAGFFLPLKWHQVIDHWLSGRPGDHKALGTHALLAPETTPVTT